jgi:hypothetical protein
MNGGHPNARPVQNIGTRTVSIVGDACPTSWYFICLKFLEKFKLFVLLNIYNFFRNLIVLIIQLLLFVSIHN